MAPMVARRARRICAGGIHCPHCRDVNGPSAEAERKRDRRRARDEIREQVES